MNDKEKKIIDKGKSAAVAAVTAASVLVGGAFSSPADVLDSTESVTYISSQTFDDEADGDEEGEYDEENSRRLTGIRKLVISLPVWVRATVCLPLWLIGTAIIWVIGTVTNTFITPLLGQIGGWLAMLILILASFYVAAKAAFPDLKLKDILNKKTVPVITLLVLAFALADNIIPLFWDEYYRIESIFRITGSLLSLLVPLAVFLHREKKRRRSLPAAEPDIDEEMRKSRRKALTLADSVR